MKILNSRVFLLLFALLPTMGNSQQCELRADLLGQSECCTSSDPMSCLKNMLASINMDNGFYQDQKVSQIHSIKAEYNIQIALLYAKENNMRSAMRYTHESLMHIQSAEEVCTEHQRERILKVKGMVLQYGAIWCNQITDEQLFDECDCESFKDIVIAAPTPQLAAITTEKSAPAPTEELVASTEATHPYTDVVLKALRRHIKTKPLHSSFTGADAIDTCTLQIDHSRSPDRVIKECFLVDSNHGRASGEKMMRIANLMHFEELSTPVSFEVTMVIRPGSSNRCSYKDGLFYVEYEAAHVADNH